MYCNKSLITTLKAFTRTSEVAHRHQAAKGDTEGAKGKAPEALKWLSHLTKPPCQYTVFQLKSCNRPTLAEKIC